jgi:poly-gamma-glutamate capsule biosynthesis protein CapA/YwtB (metallophosphatase superfamily)
VTDRRPDRVTLLLAGDVMTGRGVDQVLPHPCDPVLYESHIRSAGDYVELAERANGPIPRPVGFAYPWGDLLAELDRRRPAARIVNLETAATTSATPARKAVNYRMHPDNAPVLRAASIDCCTLANNHVLDWGEDGLHETLATLDAIGMARVGAGADLAEASVPAELPVPGGRVIVLALGSPTSGIPAAWAATEGRAGIDYLPALDPSAVERVARRVRAVKRPGDVVVASVHWGGNWGYEVPDEQRRFAHGLIDRAGVDLVFGHSSHHPKPIGVHAGKLVLYGCGDLINDYEGISGYERFRDDLVLAYLATIRLADGTLERLTMLPFRLCRLRLAAASPADARWLCDTLTREGSALGTRPRPGAGGALGLTWSE